VESDLEDFDEDSMDTLYTEEDEEHMEWSESPEYLLSLFSNLESTWEVLGQHRAYLNSLLRAHALLLKGDGPLPVPVRHFLAVMAASRHSCSHLVEKSGTELLAEGGPVDWVETGIKAATTKVQRLSEINAILAHQPWTLTPAHIEQLTKSGSPGNWSISELVYAIVLMAHFHSLSSFIESCVAMEDVTLQKQKSAKNLQRNAPKQEHTSPPNRPYDCTQPCRACSDGTTNPVTNRNRKPKKSKSGEDPSPSPQDPSPSPPYDCTQPKTSPGSPGTDRVDTLVQRMEQLRTKPEPNQDELTVRFQDIERTSAEIGKTGESAAPTVPDVRKYLSDPDFHYVDFAQRERKNEFPTFRVQDYSWEDEGYSLVSRFYDDIAQLLDDKFKTAYNLTYGTMGRLAAIDTSMFRRATWNYIQCLYGIRWDDYDYAEVNDLLHRSLKKYIKTAACYPESCDIEDYNSIMTDFQPSEKIHVCLLVSEAKFQSELLYAFRAIADHFRS